MSDSDWRKWAYTQASNWPEAVPWMGPKRRYGPYPWGRPTHDDEGLDDYPHRHIDANSCGDGFLGDVCPYCGVPLRWTEEVYLIDGTFGIFGAVDETDDPTPAYHPDCWRERQAEKHGNENTTRTEYA